MRSVRVGLLCVLLLALCVLGGCVPLESSREGEQEGVTPVNVVAKTAPVDVNNVPLVDIPSLYAEDDPSSLVHFYVTVRRGSQADGTDHTLEEVNSVVALQGMLGVEKLKAEVIFQEGDENGPQQGMLGYAATGSNGTIRIRGKTSTLAPQKSYRIDLFDSAGLWRGQRAIRVNPEKTVQASARKPLSVTTYRLLDAVMVWHTENYAHPQTVTLSFREYADLCDVRDVRFVREQMQVDAEYLLNMEIDAPLQKKYPSKKEGERISFYLFKDIKSIRGGYVFTFGEEFYQMLCEHKSSFMYCPEALWRINLSKNPLSYFLLRKLAVNKRTNLTKEREKRADTLSIKALSRALPLFPTYDDVQKSGRNTSRRMIRPFERDMNALSMAFSWRYCHEKGMELEHDELPIRTYTQFQQLFVNVQWHGYPVKKSIVRRYSLNDLGLLSKHTASIREAVERIQRDAFRQIDPSIASVMSSEMYIHDFFSDDGETEPLPLFSSGIPVLDRALGGGIHSEYIVIGAEPGMGKTTLTLQIAHNLAKAGNIVLFYSFEMRPENLISKCISRFSFEHCIAESLPYEMALESQEVLTLRSDRDALGLEKRKMYEKMDGRFSTNLCFPHGNYTLEKIRCDVAFHVAQGNGRKVVVIVDYLQKMSTKGNSKREQVEAITAGLQDLRIKYDIPVIALSSINKQTISKDLELGDFKESSNIGHDADVALALQFSAVGDSKYNVNKEKKKNPRDIDILILKQRVGTTGNTIHLHYYAKWDCFMESDGIVNEKTTVKKTLSKGTK